MVKHFPRTAAVLLVLLVLCSRAQGQNKSRFSEKDYARTPLWGQLMDDTTASFFEVERAFNTYFAHHELPEGESEEMGDRREKEKHLSRRAVRRIAAENRLRMAVKRYRFWHEQTLPYVQPDGRILTPSERVAIWQRQQQAR